MLFTSLSPERPLSWKWWGVIFELCLALALGFGGVAYTQTQTFDSTSTGADGALNLTTPGNILFNPPNMTPPLNPAIPNVFNFTTINIASGVTVQLSGGIFTAPVYWLATGAVEIDGVINLNGADGHPFTSFLAQRIPSVPGPGGYPGGVGGSTGSNQLAEPGSGPGGGGAAPPGGGNGNNATNTFGQDPIPLIGGSGGGGSNWNNGSNPYPGFFGAGGGAGGGALVIASSVSITVNCPGATCGLSANGGGTGPTNVYGCIGDCGGSGSGGVIRLVAPVVNLLGNPFLYAMGSSSGPVQGAAGLIRIEAFQENIQTSFINPSPVQSIPFPVLAPMTPPSAIQVASIAGMPINANPFPNLTINSSAPVPVVIQAQYVSPGTTPTLYIFSENGPDQIIPVPAPGLTGTLQSSTATVNVTFPPGGSNGFVKAVWNNGALTNAIKNPKAKR